MCGDAYAGFGEAGHGKRTGGNTGTALGATLPGNTGATPRTGSPGHGHLDAVRTH